ncbi:MAG: hypothetical protein RL616_2224 [Verrucomicrobiota bacterium]
MKSFFIRAAVGLSLLASLVVVSAQTNSHNFVRWENEISTYERSDATNPPPKGCFVFIGSSTIARWKTIAEDFPGVPVVNRGFGGSEIMDATHFAARVVVPYAPKKVFLRAGGNDLAAGKSAEEVFTNFTAFAETVHAALPSAEIIYISQSPSLARWKQHEAEKTLNTLAAAYVQEKPWMKYIETYDIVFGADGMPRAELFVADKLHFNAEGYKLLAERVRPLLEQ